jgi:hypothetical protein
VLEDKLKHYGETKDECTRLKAENDKLKADLRFLRVVPREGSKCPTCQVVYTKSGSPRQLAQSLPQGSISPRPVNSLPVATLTSRASSGGDGSSGNVSPVNSVSVVPATRAARTVSLADDSSPHKKALPVAPPSDDEDGELVITPRVGDAAGKRGSVLAALNPADIKKQMIERYGQVDLGGARRASLPPEPDSSSGGESDDSDAPELPPKPSRQSISEATETGFAPGAGAAPATTAVASAGVATNKSMTGTMGRKSPRYMSDPMKTSIPLTSEEERNARLSRDVTDGSSPSHVSATGTGSVVESMRKTSSSGVGSLSKGTSFSLSAMFRARGPVSSMDESGGTDTDSEIVPPGDSVYSRSHSLMDAAESLRWRKLASEGAAQAVTLTPINVTTINKTIYYLVRVESPDSSWVVPRTFEQFRDFRQNLVFEFPSAVVPQPPSKVFVVCCCLFLFCFMVVSVRYSKAM